MFKNVLTSLILVIVIGMSTCFAGETPLKLENFTADKADRIKIKDEVAIVTYGACLKSKTVYPITAGKQYGIKGSFSALPETPANVVYLGFEVVDKDGKNIAMVHAKTVPETFTKLVQDVKATDTVLHVEDGSKWKKGGFSVAFKAAQDLSDLPNRNIAAGTVTNIAKKDTTWEITLNKPCGIEAKSGEFVREHQLGGYIYTFHAPTHPAVVDPEQTIAINYAGAAGIRIVILANWGVIKQQDVPRLEIKNLRLIEK